MNKNVKTEQRQETEATVKIYRNKERTDYLYDPEEEKLGKKYLEKNLSVDGMQDTIMTKLNKEGFWDKEKEAICK